MADRKCNRSHPTGGTDTRHLQLRRRRWYYQRGIPRELQAAFGARLFSRSLGTSDLNEARRRRDLLDREFAAKLAELAPDADAWSPEGLISTASYTRLNAPAEAPETFEQEVARVAAHQPTPMQVVEPELVTAIERGEAIATGTTDESATRLSEAIAEHLEHLAGTARPGSVAARRRALEHLQAYLGDVPVAGIIRRQLSKWVATFPDSESRKTKSNRIGDVAAFFAWSVDVGIITQTPAANLRKLLREDTRGDEQKAENGKVRPWSVAEVRELLARMEADLEADDPLHGLVKLALYTGARREELAQLKGRDVEVDDGVQVLKIRQGKSRNAVRTIPVHPEVRDLVTGIKPDAYILPMDGNETADGRRAHTTGDRFSRFKKAAGFDASLTFHGLRRAVAKRLESAGVPQNVAESILGHYRASLSFGLYSDGADVAVLAEAIESIRY